MAHQTKPRLGESTTTTGTGPFTLAGALTAHKRFSAECSVADTLWGNISAVDSSGNETGDWVEGLFTYSAANEVTLTTVYKSSNSDLAVTFGAGTKYVTLIADARQIAAAPRGGTTDQVLAKTGAGDYATAWVTPAADVAASIVAAVDKATPVDADSLGLVDSAAANVLKELTWANVKATLKTYFDALTTTLTNKRITARVTSEADSATPTINTNNSDVHRVTALTVAITSMTTNLTGTANHGDRLIVEITGTAARAITWGLSFESSAVALPTTTVTTEMLTTTLRWNSATSKWRCVAVTSAAAAGLTNFTEAVNTAAPNATVPVVSLTATNAATNVDIALVPKGTGAITANVADNLAAGGNKRGTGAVDLQTARATATQVASGDSSFCVGNSNTASNTGSFAAGYQGNVASGYQSIAIGGSNTASNNNAVAVGANCIASGYGAQALGRSALAPNPGQFSRGYNPDGYSQQSWFNLYTATTNATPANIRTGDYAANYMALTNNTTWEAEIRVVGRLSGGASNACFKRRVLIKRDANAASTALVGSVETIGTDIGSNAGTPPAGWAVTITADTTNGALNVAVTGAAATNIKWSALVDINETIYA